MTVSSILSLNLHLFLLAGQRPPAPLVDDVFLLIYWISFIPLIQRTSNENLSFNKIINLSQIKEILNWNNYNPSITLSRDSIFSLQFFFMEKKEEEKQQKFRRRKKGQKAEWRKGGDGDEQDERDSVGAKYGVVRG